MALQSNELDMMQRVASTDLTLFENNPEYEVQMATGTRVQFLFMNVMAAPFDDINIRKAFNAAVNYDAIAKVIGGGVSGVGSPFPPSATFYDELQRATYDPAAAESYLAEAGYKDTDGDGYVDKDGEKLTINILMSSSDSTILAESVQSHCKDCGIDVQLVMSENVSDTRNAGDFQLVFANWQTLSTGDPQWFLDQVFKTGATDNYGGYSNEDLDELIDELSVTFDVDERMEIAKQASQIIIDEAFGCFLVDVTNINVCHSKVKNMSTFPIDYYFLTPQTTFAE
jgi:peptide/nickel transport system substrate-binding protein